MTTQWPSSCVGAVSRVYTSRHVGVRLASAGLSNRQTRWYATQKSDQKNDDVLPEQSALAEVKGLRKGDPINPARSTRPPLLKLPEQGDANVALYYFRIGRAYGSFYWCGVKAVWFNYKAATLFKERHAKELGKLPRGFSEDQALKLLTRSEFQLWERVRYDIGKLPFFGILVALFGEWLPLIVPFIPAAVPKTCRIPKQIEDMRKRAEERRKASFRIGVAGPKDSQLTPGFQTSEAQPWPAIKKAYTYRLLSQLRDDQLLHLSTTLNLHSSLWDRLEIAPPPQMSRKAIAARLAYLTFDDKLLLKTPSAFQKLNTEEVHIACEERGIDVLGVPEEALRTTLRTWLERQGQDKGRGSAILKLLFRRPNAWDTKKGD